MIARFLNRVILAIVACSLLLDPGANGLIHGTMSETDITAFISHSSQFSHSDHMFVSKLESVIEKETYIKYKLYKNINSSQYIQLTRSYSWVPDDLAFSVCNQSLKKVAFLKVHKAASTTVMNIFLRFGDSNRLNIALPKTTKFDAFNYLGFESILNKSRIMTLPENETIDIVCNHAIFNKEVYKDVLGPEAVYIGILRDPTTLFPSASLFYGYIDYFRDCVGRHLDDQQLLSIFLEATDIFHPCPHTHISMLEDLGFPVEQHKNLTIVENYLVGLDHDLDLMMFMEHFDESLVLMKNVLCWEIKDILYVPLNINKEKKENGIILTEKDQQNLFSWDYPDYRLYVHFLEKFFIRIKMLGNKFIAEVEYFKRIKEIVRKHCFSCQQQFTDCNELVIDKSPWSESFIIGAVDCRFMMTDEEPLLKELMKKARRRFGYSSDLEDIK